MHEMSIAMNVVELAVQTASREGAGKITTIELEIGPLAGVLADALTFCFEAASRNTPAQGAELLIHPGRAIGRCLSCGRENEMRGFGDKCPQCGAFLARPQGGGDSLRIMAITVDDEASVIT